MAKGAAHNFAERIGFIHGAELAEIWGYASVNDAFRNFCLKNRITHVPGRPGWFDPHLVRRRLDEVQGLSNENRSDKPLSLVEMRKARNGTL